MRLSPDEMERLVAYLRHDEGQRLRAYDDATGLPVSDPTQLKGKLTIADGFNLQRAPLADIGQMLRAVGVSLPYTPTLRELCQLTITSEQADALLARDLPFYTGTAASLVTIPAFTNFAPARRVAWINFVYNEGGEDFPGTEHLLAQAQGLKDKGDTRAHATFKLAADHMRLSAWYGQVGDRAKRITAMIESGVYCSPTGDGSDVL